MLGPCDSYFPVYKCDPLYDPFDTDKRRVPAAVRIRFDGPSLSQIIQNGVPSHFRNLLIALANVFVQSNINAFGKMAMAGCGSYSKIEGFVFLPVTCFNMALTTFVSQNLGAKQYDRAKKGAWFGILCSMSIAELIGFAIYTVFSSK